MFLIIILTLDILLKVTMAARLISVVLIPIKCVLKMIFTAPFHPLFRVEDGEIDPPSERFFCAYVRGELLPMGA